MGEAACRLTLRALPNKTLGLRFDVCGLYEVCSDNNDMRIASIAAIALLVTLATIPLDSQSTNPLRGVWRVAEIVPPAGAPISSPQPTMYLFAARHYSHVSVTSPEPRPNYVGADVTDKQKLEMYEPFTATAGTYDVAANEFTIRPLVARNPGFMTPGAFTTFRFDVDGQSIWIRAVRGPGGAIPENASNRVRLVRLE